MDDWFSYKPSGQYCPDVLGRSNANFYTFMPNPLSETDFKIKMDAELTSLLSATHRLLGQLEGMSGFLPNIAAIESIIIQKEALLSCQTDGINIPFYKVLDSSHKTDEITLPVKNYVSAISHSLEKVKTTHYKNTLLLDIHKELNLRESTNPETFRAEYTTIGKIKVITNGFPTYNPTAPAQLSDAMRDMEKFIRRDDDIDILIKVALAHYQFETIHPFMSGNGRVGRILPYLILADKKILTRPLLCLSHYLNLNKTEYFDRMDLLHRQCDYEQWVKFFIRAVLFAVDDSLQRIKEWLIVRESNLNKIQESGKTVKSIKSLYDCVERQPIFDIRTIVKQVGISYNTGASAIRTLTGLEIVQQINHMERNRDYACLGFLNCFIGKDMFLE